MKYVVLFLIISTSIFAELPVPINVRSGISAADIARIPTVFKVEGGAIGLLQWDAPPDQPNNPVVGYEIRKDGIGVIITYRTDKTEFPFISGANEMINVIAGEFWTVRAVYLSSERSAWVNSGKDMENITIDYPRVFVQPAPPETQPAPMTPPQDPSPTDPAPSTQAPIDPPVNTQASSASAKISLTATMLGRAQVLTLSSVKIENFSQHDTNSGTVLGWVTASTLVEEAASSAGLARVLEQRQGKMLWHAHYQASTKSEIDFYSGIAAGLAGAVLVVKAGPSF